MWESTMILAAERAADQRRELAVDPLLARSARLGDRCMCLDEAATTTRTRRSRAAPRTLAPRRRSYTQAA
jgi:hypothetical protein